MRDRPALRLLHGGGESIRGISRTQGASRNAVRRALADGSRDQYYRPSFSEEAEPAVRDVLADYPHMTVHDIGLLIDWRHSRRTLSDLVARLRPEYQPGASLEATSISMIRVGKLGTVGILKVGKLEVGTMEIGEVLIDEQSYRAEAY